MIRPATTKHDGSVPTISAASFAGLTADHGDVVAASAAFGVRLVGPRWLKSSVGRRSPGRLLPLDACRKISGCTKPSARILALILRPKQRPRAVVDFGRPAVQLRGCVGQKAYSKEESMLNVQHKSWMLILALVCAPGASKADFMLQL